MWKTLFPNPVTYHTLILRTYVATVCKICLIFIATVPSFERNAICDAVNEYYPSTINESTNVHWLVVRITYYSTELYFYHVYARIFLKNKCDCILENRTFRHISYFEKY